MAFLLLESHHLRCRQFLCILLNAVKREIDADTKEVGNRESCASGGDGDAPSSRPGFGSESVTAEGTRIG